MPLVAGQICICGAFDLCRLYRECVAITINLKFILCLEIYMQMNKLTSASLLFNKLIYLSSLEI